MKPLILLIVNTGFWSTGEIGKQIVHCFRHKYDFLFVSERVMASRPDMLNAALLRADLVFCLNESGPPLLRNLARVPLPPLITWIHHVTAWNDEHECAARMSALIIACTPGWKERIASYAPTSKIDYIRHGVDLEFFSPQPISRRSLGIPDTAFVAGFFGALGSDRDGGRKGMDILLAVFRHVAAAVPQLHAVFAGPGWEDFASELRATGAHATVFGFVPRSRLPAMYSLLDVYLVTARVEGGPMTVLESLACGTPVVASRVGLVPEVVVDGVNGFSAEVGDIDTLAGALLKISARPELKAALKAASRESVENRSWADMLAPLEPILDSFMAQSPKRAELPTVGWIEDPDGAHRVCYAAECLANTITDLRHRRAPLFRSFRILRDMLEGAKLIDCIRGLGLLRGYGYRSGS